MTETLGSLHIWTHLPAFAAGLLLGSLFFGGLWFTVQKLTSSKAALWFPASAIVRMSVVLIGFYFVGRESWQRMVACLLGFYIARIFVLRLTRIQKVIYES